MNATVKKLLFYIPTTALGIWCAVLQNRILTTGFDHKGLLIAGNPDLMLLWGITGLYLLAAAVLTLLLGGNGTYADNYPGCALSGGAMIAAGLVMGFTGLNNLVPGMLHSAVLTMGVGVLMALCGVMRILGKNPTAWPDLLTALYVAYHVMVSYGGWNADPHVQRYAFHLLAEVAVLLFTLHRARMAGGYPERKRLVFFGFAGMFLCFAAIPGADNGLYYLACGLWCAGGMSDLKRLEKKPDQAN